jgi:hypothetical protein
VQVAKSKKSQKNTFVGTLPGTEALIGVVIGKSSAVAYLCDSKKLEQWLTGVASEGVLALESEQGSTLVARRSGNKLRGTVVLADNQTLAFDAVKATGKAGVFRKGDTVKGITLSQTWVRLADGTTKGASGIGEGIADLATAVDDAGPSDDPQGVRAAEQSVIDEIANGAGVEPPTLPAPEPVNPTPPEIPVVDPVGDLAVPPQIPKGCPPFFNLVTSRSGSASFCILDPSGRVPQNPQAGAVPPVPPPLDETIAGAPAEPPANVPTTTEPPSTDTTAKGTTTPPALGPAAVTLPAEPVFDAEACSRIGRALSLVADEFDALPSEGNLTRLVLASVFSHLRVRGTLGGCQGLPTEA